MQFVVVLFLSQLLVNLVAPVVRPPAHNQIMGGYSNRLQGTVACQAVAALSHFFSLATFSWLSVLAIDLTNSLSTTTALAQKGRIRTKRTAMYVIFGWGIPSLVIFFVCVCTALHYRTVNSEIFYSSFYYGGFDCWLNPNTMSILALMVPVCGCLFANLIFFITVIYRLKMIRRECQVLDANHTAKGAESIIAALRLYIKV